MSSRKNRDIRGFFQSAGPLSSQTQHQNQVASSPPPTSDLSSLLRQPSSPRTPPKSTPRVFSRDDEIKGSDDSDDDSDDSLGSITNALGYRAGPAAHRRESNVLSTPQAKRIASGIHQSPLTLQPKKHKFDLKALISHSREIERTEQSARKADALIALAEENGENSDDSDAENDPRRPDGAATHHLLADSDDSDGKGDKIRRAFQRSKDDEASSRKHCYFFHQEAIPSSPSKNVFPRKKAAGRWKFLSQPDMRRQAFIMGLPYTFAAQGETLPDEIFIWILNEICIEQNGELRRQYINLTELCEDHTKRLLNDRRLYYLLERVGGPKYSHEHNKFKSTTEVRPEYLERNWSPLVTFLQLLSRVAPNLQPATAISAVQLLLRMSMDPVVAAVVREHHMHAITILVSSLARSKSRWNTACKAICSYMYDNIDDLELTITSLLSIPSSSSHLVDLRRRIAAETLFNKPGLGSKPVDLCLTFEIIRSRLDEDDFKSTNKVDFDFERLRALTTLLDMVIDRGDFMRAAINRSRSRRGSNSTTAKGTTPHSKARGIPNLEETATAAVAEEDFDTEIDILAARVKVIHDRIRDKASRKNVKLSLLGLEKRLKYAVRTRTPPKRGIFAFEGSPARDPDANVPKQRDFMRQWALKKAEKQNPEEDVPESVEFTSSRPQRATRNVQVVTR